MIEFGPVSRRAFLQLVAAAGACVGYALHGSRALAHGCVCGATVVSASQPAGFNEAQGFCPNCGRSLRDGGFKLRSDRWRSSSRRDGPRWNAAQVPFPNPELVQVTEKPRVSLATVRVRRGSQG